jgi:ssDNA-binding Zn-finger/Zn-ribbon topoisomerase 1
MQFACQPCRKSITISLSHPFDAPRDSRSAFSFLNKGHRFVMAETLVCPKCDSPIRVPAAHVGAEILCPKCDELVSVSSGEAGPEAVMERTATAGKKSRRAAPIELDEDAPPPPPKRGAFKPCPRCGAEGAQRVMFTPWGSFYGPALFNHVRCPECRYAYNGRSGGSNLIPAILFVAIPLLLMAAIIGYVVLLIIPRL